MTNKNFCPISSQMWITQGGGRLDRNNEFVATNLLSKPLNFRSKNSLKNQIISNDDLYRNLEKNICFTNLSHINFVNILLKKQSFLYAKSHRNLIKNKYILNDNYIILCNNSTNNQVKNLTNTHFSNLKNIKLYFRNIKHYIKNLIYFRHTISGLFRIYCQRLN